MSGEQLRAAIEGARAYEGLHVPALFRPFAASVLDRAGVDSGHEVLDVACGTGVLAREALRRVGPEGAVTGLDIGPGMLAVAEELEPRITWIEGDAGDLPFDDDRFDAVISQFGLMFFPDRVGAVAEMLRVARPDARVVVAVWDSLQRSMPFPIVVDLLHRRAGPAAADALRAPFALGDVDELESVFTKAGCRSVSIERQVEQARFPSTRTMFEADLRGWLPVMGVLLEESLIGQLLDEADDLLSEYADETDEMVFDAPAHVVTAIS